MSDADLPLLWYIEFTTSTGREIKPIQVVAPTSTTALLDATLKISLDDGETIVRIEISKPRRLAAIDPSTEPTE